MSRTDDEARRRRTLGTILLGLAVSAAIAGALWALDPWDVWAIPPWRNDGRDRTVHHFTILEDIIRLLERDPQHAELADMEALRRYLSEHCYGDKSRWTCDGWETPMRLYKVQNGRSGGPTYLLRSAGPDHTMNTDDDLTHLVEVEEDQENQEENQGQPPILTVPTTQPATTPSEARP